MRGFFMTKFWLVFFFVIGFVFATEAKVLFACEGTSKILNPGKPIHFKLSQKVTKEFEVEKDGVEASNLPNETITEFSPNLDGLSEFLKCGNYDEACKGKLSKGKDAGFADFGGVVGMAKALDESAKGASTLVNLNLNDVKSGKSYIFGEKDKTNKFGNMGVYEFYNKDKKLLGRYIYALEVMDCKDKVTYSAGSAAKKKQAASAGEKVKN